MIGGMIDGRLIARALMMALILALAVYLGRGSHRSNPATMARSLAAVILLMLLLSPTLYPWYYVPAAAIGALTFQVGFLVWTPLLVLTYLTGSSAYPSLLVALIHVPVWIALVQLLLPLGKGTDNRVQEQDRGGGDPRPE
jgi:hypothetical protein